jgi:hypothetical protein
MGGGFGLLNWPFDGVWTLCLPGPQRIILAIKSVRLCGMLMEN